MKESVLITGGNGFIGAHVSNKFVSLGYKVFVLCRRGTSDNVEFNQNVEKGNIQVIKGSIVDFDYNSIHEKFKYIIHVAGKVSPYGKLEDFLAINYDSTKRLLEYANTQPSLECFSYLSSTAVYGYGGYKHLLETAPKKPFNNPYSISKLQTENLVKTFAEKNNINYLILRPGNVFGEYDYTSSNEIYSRVKRQKMSICAGGKYLSCFVYSGNLAEAIAYTTTHPSCYNTDYNITDGQDETLKEYLTMVANEFGVKPKFTNFPAPLAKMVASLVEGTYKLFHIKKAPLITKFSIWQNCADYNFSIDKLLRTGYKPTTDFKTAIKNTCEWYNSIDTAKKK